MRIYIIAISITICFHLFCLDRAAAQQTGKEFWYNMIIRHKVTKTFSIFGQANLKTNLAVPKLKSVYAEMGVSYKPLEYLESTLYYRHITSKPFDIGVEHKYRWMVDITTKWPVSNWQLSMRTRFQQQYLYKWKYTDVKQIPEQLLKMKYNISYNIPNTPLEPFMFAEWYYPVIEQSLYKHRSYKLGLGLDWKVLKKYTIEFEYFYEKEIRPELNKAHILQISYLIKI